MLKLTRCCCLSHVVARHKAQRFQNVMLTGLWFGSHESVVSIFLRPFADQAKTLASKGVLEGKWNLCEQQSCWTSLLCRLKGKTYNAKHHTV